MHLVKLDFVRKKKWKKAIRQKSIVHYSAVLHSVISDILLFTVVQRGFIVTQRSHKFTFQGLCIFGG